MSMKPFATLIRNSSGEEALIWHDTREDAEAEAKVYAARGRTVAVLKLALVAEVSVTMKEAP